MPTTPHIEKHLTVSERVPNLSWHRRIPSEIRDKERGSWLDLDYILSVTLQRLIAHTT
jgi:hypothetical protein